jgi:hypothetical protein
VALLGGQPTVGAGHLDTHDWPVAIAAGYGHDVWVALSTEEGDVGSLARYGEGLELEELWGLEGAPRVAAVGPSLDVFVDLQPGDRLARFSRDGRLQHSWDTRQSGAMAVALDVDGAGLLHLLWSDADRASGISTFDGEGTRKRQWSAPEDSVSLAADSSGHIFVGQAVRTYGAIHHFDPQGAEIVSWITTATPVGLDVGPEGLLYAGGDYGTARGDVTVYDREGNFVRGLLVDARILDLSVGNDGSVYLVVWSSGDDRHEVRKYDSHGNLLLSLVEFGPIERTPAPATASPTATTIVRPTHTPSVPPAFTVLAPIVYNGR